MISIDMKDPEYAGIYRKRMDGDWDLLFMVTREARESFDENGSLVSHLANMVETTDGDDTALVMGSDTNDFTDVLEHAV